MEPLEPRRLMATYWVDSPSDAAAGADDSTTLRGAIYRALRTPEDDVIRLDLRETLRLTRGEIVVDAPNGGSLTIRGVGAEKIVLDGGENGRLFNVAAGSRLVLADLTLTGGNAESGGAVVNRGSLTLDSVDVCDSTATGNGGGIENFASLVLRDSTVSGCRSASGNGGGIANSGTLTVDGGGVCGNEASVKGGGIWNSAFGDATLEAVDVSANVALTHYGGGVCNEGSARFLWCDVRKNVVENANGAGVYSSGTTELANSVVAANWANGVRASGGGVCVAFGETRLTNCVVSGNKADWEGGGLYLVGGKTTLVNSLLTLNLAEARSDLSGTLDAASSHNLVGVDPGFVAPPRFDYYGNFVDVDATDFRLRPDSPAIDAGKNELAVRADGTPIQYDSNGRGYVRVRAADPSETPTVDLGAFEYCDPTDVPYVFPERSQIAVREDGAFYLEATASAKDGATFWYDFGDGRLVEKDGAFWAAASELLGSPELSGERTILVVAADKRGVFSAPVALSVAVEEVAPTVDVKITPLSDDRILRLELSATYSGGRTARFWRVNWGDGSPTVEYDSLSTALTAARVYERRAETKTYNVSLELVDANGSGVKFSVATHTVEGAIGAAVSTPALSDVATPSAANGRRFIPITPESTFEQAATFARESAPERSNADASPASASRRRAFFAEEIASTSEKDDRALDVGRVDSRRTREKLNGPFDWTAIDEAFFNFENDVDRFEF